ncbi:hypothetical protein BST61_g8994 [Cercospora zeina]
MAAVGSQVPNKRQKTFATQDDFVSLQDEEDSAAKPTFAASASRSRSAHHHHHHADRPRSKHALQDCEPWLLIKTKTGRRFVHNPVTSESFWRIPQAILPAVLALEQSEREQKEKAENAAWAERQLQQMRPQQPPAEVSHASGPAAASERRRRSVSLQREDEAALMAELDAQAEGDAAPASASAANLPARTTTHGYDSDGSYEEVEVTDSEDEHALATGDLPEETSGSKEQPQDRSATLSHAPVEFGEDDIAYQLAAMGEDYELDAGEYGDEPEAGWEAGAEGLGLTEEDATNLFRDLLDDYRISPFIPWDKVTADESENSILNDDRYTVLPNMKARREVFDMWARDKAAQVKAERATLHKLNPKIPYLAFLEENANPKLYWPEFKRKHKRETVMSDRKLSDKDREKSYRDYIARLKLPESTRQADLQSLLQSVPLSSLNSQTTIDSLPELVLSHVHYICLPPKVRDTIVAAHIRSLPAVDDRTAQDATTVDMKSEDRKRREQALADREAKVRGERKRQAMVEERAKRELREGERELERAMARGNRAVHSTVRHMPNNTLTSGYPGLLSRGVSLGCLLSDGQGLTKFPFPSCENTNDIPKPQERPQAVTASATAASRP